MSRALLFALLPLALAATPAAPPVAPTLSPGSVLRPAFTLADGKTYEAGVAFAVESAGETLVLTAYQLFGPPGGMPAAIPAGEIATQVKSARCTDAWTHDRVGIDLVAVNLPSAHVMGNDAVGDLTIFRIPVSLDRLGGNTSTPFHGLPLAAADPKKGDTVWLAGPALDSTTPLQSAKIVEASPTFLFYAFDAKTNLTALSGSPLVNAKGEVVGIHLGGGERDGQTIGAAGPVSAIKKDLAEAIKP